MPKKERERDEKVECRVYVIFPEYLIFRYACSGTEVQLARKKQTIKKCLNRKNPALAAATTVAVDGK